MKKNIFTLIFGLLVLFLFLTFTDSALGEKLATLTEIMKPGVNLEVDDENVYVTEKTTIFIYSLKDFKLKNKFGKAGEGPEEFKNFVLIRPQTGHLLINSAGKLSYFKKDGTFIKELKTKAGIRSAVFFPLKEGFIGRGIIREDKTVYQTINFFNSNLEKGKELYRVKAPEQQGGKIELFQQPFAYQTHENKIYVAAKKGFIIDVLDHTGKLLFSFHRKYEKRKFTPEDEKNVRNAIKSENRQNYELIKDRLSFPDYYPEILNLFIDNHMILVATWKIENDRMEFFFFDMKGKFLKKSYIKILFINPLQPYPVTIKNGKVYQLIENEEEEEWELHAWTID